MRKGIRFGFVLTEDEKTALTKLAELEGGLSEAATVRRLIRRAAREAGVWKLKKQPSQSRESQIVQTSKGVDG